MRWAQEALYFQSKSAVEGENEWSGRSHSTSEMGDMGVSEWHREDNVIGKTTEEITFVREEYVHV